MKGKVRRRAVDAAALFGSVVVGAVFYCYWCLDLFPLVEFRDWVVGVVQLHLSSRPVSLAFAWLAGTIAGNDVVALNALALMPVVASAVLAYLLGRRLGLGPVQSGVATLIWWFSPGVASALSWQATLHDRLAWLFSLLVLLVALRAMDRSRRVRGIVAANIAIAVLLAIGFRCKEASWFLLPALVAAAVVLPCSEGHRRRRLACIAGPVLIGVIDVVRHVFLTLPADARLHDHVLNGASARPLTALLAELAGGVRVLDGSSLVILCIPLLAAGAIICGGRRAWQTPSSRFWLFACLSFIAAFAIALPTKYRATYYLYVPTWLFALLLMLSLNIIADRVALLRRIPCATLLMTLGVATFWGARFVKRFESVELPLYRASGAFQASFAQIRRTLPQPPEREVWFVAPRSAYFAYKFWAGSKGGLLRLIYPGSNHPAVNDLESKVRGIRLEAFPSAVDDLPETGVVFIYDAYLRLVRVQLGAGQVLYQRGDD